MNPDLRSKATAETNSTVEERYALLLAGRTAYRGPAITFEEFERGYRAFKACQRRDRERFLVALEERAIRYRANLARGEAMAEWSAGERAECRYRLACVLSDIRTYRRLLATD